VLLKDLLWQATASYTKIEFYRVMDEIKRISKDAHAYLEKVNPNTWCQGWFNTNAKYGLLYNNTCESFNSWIKKYSDQTILTMLEKIRCKLMRRYVRKEMINSMEDALGPKTRKKLAKEKDETVNCCCTYAENHMFEVECLGRMFVVYVNGRSCGCRKWDITGISCCHAISTILHQGGDPNDYLSPYHSKEMYLKSYDHIVYPVPIEEQWPRSNQPKIEPPKSRATPDRPKKVRQMGVEEPRNLNSIMKGAIRINVATVRNLVTTKHKEKRDHVRQFYRDNATTGWNLDMISELFSLLYLWFHV
jgi:hypothetical protein